MKIVVRTPNWIGDSILAIPSIRCLKENFPNDQICIAALHWVKDVFKGFDFIDEIISLTECNGLKGMKINSQKLQNAHFDLGVLLTNSFSSALLFYMAKIPKIWGYQKDGRNILLTKGVRVKTQDEHLHQSYYYTNLITELGLKSMPFEPSLPLSQDEKQKAEDFLASCDIDFSKPLVIINPGAFYGSAKRWPVSRYAELAVLLQNRNKTEIIIVGSSEEIPLAESIASSMNKKPLILSGKTNLRQLASIISHADLFITNDSGPMHLANALKIPIVALFGPTDPLITGPLHSPSTVIHKKASCWPCSYRECPFDHRCMMKIEPEEVYQACQAFLR